MFWCKKIALITLPGDSDIFFILFLFDIFYPFFTQLSCPKHTHIFEKILPTIFFKIYEKL